MQSAKKSSTRPALHLPNAFSAHFLDRARRADRAARAEGDTPDTRALAAGPWDVRTLDAPHGRAHAVVRCGDATRDGGGGAVALCRSYPQALQLAAVLPALATPNHLEIGDPPKPLGLALHDGGGRPPHPPPPRPPPRSRPRLPHPPPPQPRLRGPGAPRARAHAPDGGVRRTS